MRQCVAVVKLAVSFCALAGLAGCAAWRQEAAEIKKNEAAERRFADDPEHHHVVICGWMMPYPSDAENVWGDVVVSLDLDERGVPVKTTLISSPDARLTRTVVDNVGKCRFEVVRDANGKPMRRSIPRYIFRFSPPETTPAW